MKHTLAKLMKEINNSTIIPEDFNTPHSIMDRTTRQKSNKDIEDLNNTMNRPNKHLQILHPVTAVYTLFSSVYGTFFRVDHMLDHKTSLSKFKRTEIIPSMFSTQNGNKLKVNKTRKFWKFTNM